MRKSSTPAIDYRQAMRDFVIALSNDAKSRQPNFIIIPQNGQALITDTGMVTGTLQMDYLNAIDAIGQESMFYGYHEENQATPHQEKKALLDLSLLNQKHQISVLATDYCTSPTKVQHAYELNQQHGFISFAANKRHLNHIPPYPMTPYDENHDTIKNIAEAKNFLYLINSERYPTKSSFIQAILTTNYDVIIMDLYHNEQAYTHQEIQQLKTKPNGGKRLVIAYLSIGEAEDYRYYWQTNWQSKKPQWIEPENPNWKGNYKVNYWHPHWQNIIFGGKQAYLTNIINSGFDGAYLDIIDAFEYFEERESQQ